MCVMQTTAKLGATLSSSVERGDAPLVVKECLRDIIGEVRSRDRAASKTWRAKQKAAKKAAAAAAESTA